MLYWQRIFVETVPNKSQQIYDCCMNTKTNKLVSHKSIEKAQYLKGEAWNLDCTGRKDTPSIVTHGCQDRRSLRGQSFKYGLAYTFKANDEESILRLVNFFSICIDRSIYIWSRLKPYFGSFSKESMVLLLMILSLMKVYPRIEYR